MNNKQYSSCAEASAAEASWPIGSAPHNDNNNDNNHNKSIYHSYNSNIDSNIIILYIIIIRIYQ